MRRRRQKNTLLPKMIGVAVLINAILLPILAEMGVFHKMQGQRLTQVSLVKLPPPEKNPAEKKKVQKSPPKRAVSHEPKGRPISSRPLPPNPNQPKVVASAPSAGGDDDNGIANNGTAAPGQVAIPAPAPVPVPQPAAKPQPAPVPAAPQPAPAPTPQPAPAPRPVAPPRAPLIVAAQPIDRPQPSIPDDLLSTEINTTYLALFTIKSTGNAQVSTLKGTGNDELDRLALDAARRWTFHPATKDGQPVDSYLRLQIEFQVSE